MRKFVDRTLEVMAGPLAHIVLLLLLLMIVLFSTLFQQLGCASEGKVNWDTEFHKDQSQPSKN